MKLVTLISEDEVLVVQLLNQEGVFYSDNAKRREQAVVFQRDELVLGLHKMGRMNHEFISLLLEAEQDLLVFVVDVPYLQEVALHCPVDVAVGHVACASRGEGVNLPQLPVAVQLPVVGRFQLTGSEDEAG